VSHESEMPKRRAPATVLYAEFSQQPKCRCDQRHDTLLHSASFRDPRSASRDPRSVLQSRKSRVFGCVLTATSGAAIPIKRRASAPAILYGVLARPRQALRVIARGLRPRQVPKCAVSSTGRMKADWERAVVSGDVEAVCELLASGADVDALDRYGQTALMLAAHKGHALVVRELIAHGANLNHTAKFGLSALMLAVIADHPEVVGLLLDAHADTALMGSQRAAPFYGKTAQQLADSMGRVRCADMFRRRSTAAPRD
jgi:uncharacterized protein